MKKEKNKEKLKEQISDEDKEPAPNGVQPHTLKGTRGLREPLTRHQGGASSSSRLLNTQKSIPIRAREPATQVNEGEEETSALEEEVSELEDDIKDAESTLDKNQFQEFIQQSSTDIPPAESFSPVLERTETPQQIIDLEHDVSSVSISGKEDDEQTGYTSSGKSEYTAKSEKGNENYTEVKKTEELIAGQPAPINVETAGRDLHPQLREVAPVSLESWESRKPHGTLEEKYVQPERIDIEKVGRETHFETRIKEIEKKKLDYKIR